MCLLIGVGMGLSWHSRCERDDSGGRGGGRIPARLAVSPSCLTGGALGTQILATREL